jgi:gamma-glutamylcyclotransferase (GGCT)/AIG2-like uncharacterized protein YtfP
MPAYFAYGANMHPVLMAERVPGAVSMGPGRLDGYSLAFNVYSTVWEGGAANLEPDEDDRVWGVLWDVPEQEKRNLDAYQGHPTFFRREEVQVEGLKGPVVAWTYRVAHQSGFIRPTDAYLNRITSAIRMMGLPPEALDVVDRAARPPGPTISV